MSGPHSASDDQAATAMLAAAHAVGRLDGALLRSPVAAYWHERAGIVAIAHSLDLAGIPLTPAEFFRAAVGLVEPLFRRDLDRGLLSAVVDAMLPTLRPGALAGAMLARVRPGSAVLVDPEFFDVPGLPDEIRHDLDTALGLARADVGTALPRLVAATDTALALARGHGALATIHLTTRVPLALAGLGLTTTALPGLTGLTPAMRYRTLSRPMLTTALAVQLATQAGEALALLRRLEACARAWQARLAGLTNRSRAGTAAALFLVWPALTRTHLAAALGLSPAGTAKVLDILIARAIVTRERCGSRWFYVAHESLGEFKLAPRQGRWRAPPSPFGSDVDDALAAFDLLGLDLGPDDADPGSD